MRKKEVVIITAILISLLVIVFVEGDSGICNGCSFDERCIPYGNRLVFDIFNDVEGNYNLYCDYDGEMKEQKLIVEGNFPSCQNSFECESNVCSNGKCVDFKKEFKETESSMGKLGPLLCTIVNPISGRERCECEKTFMSEDESALVDCGEEPVISGNIKNINAYGDKQVFLISDKNWRDVLQLVPLTTWTQQDRDNSECQRGYGTPENVCVYPTLIYHEEEEITSVLINKDYLGIQINPSTLNNIDIRLEEKSLQKGETNNFKLTLENNLDSSVFFSLETKRWKYREIDLNSRNVYISNLFGASNGDYYLLNHLNNDRGDSNTFNLLPRETKEYSLDITLNEIYSGGFDADSIIYFMQQYNTEKVIVAGETPQELDNLLVAERGFGAGLEVDNIQRINSEDILSYWDSYEDVVYVEDDYELSLIASTYASLINAPLIIEGTELDEDINFEGRNMICVGNVGRGCDENYNLEELQQKYVDETNTDKIILVNPNDLDIKVDESFMPDKSSKGISELYSKTSLASPILASAKHELIISTTATDYGGVDGFIEGKIDDLFPEIINNENGLQRNNYAKPTKKIFRKDINTGEESTIKLVNSYIYKMILSGEKILFNDGSFYVYTLDNQNLQKIELNAGYSYNYDFSQEKIFYGKNSFQCDLFLYDTITKSNLLIRSYPGACEAVAVEGDNLVWIENAEGVCGDDETISCNTYKDCPNSCSHNGSLCKENNDCGENNWCYSGFCKTNKEIYLKEGNESEQNIVTLENLGGDSLGISRDNIIFFEGNKIGGGGLHFYNILSKKLEVINSGVNAQFPRIDGDYLLWVEGAYASGKGWIGRLYLYDMNTNQKSFISEIDVGHPPQIDNGKILFFGLDRVCKESGMSCLGGDDCPARCSISREECNIDGGDCSGGEYCNSEQCVSTKAYVYDIISSQTTEVEIPLGIQNSLIKNDEIFYVNEEENNFYISGFLTIFGAPNAIPLREDIGATGGMENYRSLDHTEYGDLFLDDRYSDMSVGRIQGITISDASSYLGRDLFYDELGRTNNIQFMASSFDYGLKLANNWTNSFNEAGYNAHCSIVPTVDVTGEDLICDIDNNYGASWPQLWENNDLISYMDHGGPNWAGISYDNIPYLENSIMYNDACSTCSTYDQMSFCNNVIRKGGLGHVGAVSVAWSGNRVYGDAMSGIYKDEFTFGESFAMANEYNCLRYMTTLFGDPTFDINPDYKLGEKLIWES